ncbi:hypothetical protein L1857_34600 [Amycolatopsis thermalba]|uniref:Uncharacterized protein n=1 Tax=Amycolatopsis thermalba TaxID=944492 RepID=A0ABY4P569_9PSEU|nr:MULTISPECIES: hypothetical protein [Amycolatopsis]UQS27565.1 hypothetical protein L1857_34600 [Amycolatopsis thermalba]
MMEELVNSRRLADMRLFAESVALSPMSRRAVDQAIGRIETQWLQRKQEQYSKALAMRDRQHAEVVEVATATAQSAKEILSKVTDGLMSPEEGRAWLRDVFSYHDQLTKQHAAIAEMEPSLAEFEAKSVDDFQDECFQRFPSDREHTPTLQQAVEEYVAEAKHRAAVRARPVAPGAVDPSQLTHPDA